MSRIAMVAPLKSWGGLERLLVSIANEFVRAGHDVELVCIRGGQVPYPAELSSAIRVTDLGTRSKLDGIPKVASWMRQARPDAILTVKDHAAQVCILARRWAGVRSRLVPVVSNMLSYVARRRMQRQFVRWLYPRADRIAALSEGVAADLEATFGVPRHMADIIYQPVISDDMDARAQRPIDHPWLSADAGEQPPVFLGAGRLEGQKNFELLIEAFARVRQTRECRLIIVGEGSERAMLEDRARASGFSADIDLPGAVPDPVPYMRRSGAFVLSSRYEGFGNVVAEALATGTPVVSVDCPSGPAEILQNGRYGWLVPPGDAAALADAMDRALGAGPQDIPAEALDPFRVSTVSSQYLRALDAH